MMTRPWAYNIAYMPFSPRLKKIPFAPFPLSVSAASGLWKQVSEAANAAARASQLGEV